MKYTRRQVADSIRATPRLQLYNSFKHCTRGTKHQRKPVMKASVKIHSHHHSCGIDDVEEGSFEIGIADMPDVIVFGIQYLFCSSSLFSSAVLSCAFEVRFGIWVWMLDVVGTLALTKGIFRVLPDLVL